MPLVTALALKRRVRVTDQTLADIRANPVTGDEVERARTALLNGINRSFNSSAGIAVSSSAVKCSGQSWFKPSRQCMRRYGAPAVSFHSSATMLRCPVERRTPARA